jgi:hypothetical protein
MRKVLIAFGLLMLLTLGTVSVAGAVGGSGVDELRGRWDVDWYVPGEEEVPPPLRILVQDIEPHPEEDNVYLANGCMRLESNDVYAPLSLQAVDNLDGTYEVSMLSTVVDEEEPPFIIRLDGSVVTYGNGVPDDEASGVWVTEFGEGEWQGRHHDRRRPKCPPVDLEALFFQGDVYIHRDLAFQPGEDATLFEAWTDIVSSAMVAEHPDGTVDTVTAYTDIFSQRWISSASSAT